MSRLSFVMPTANRRSSSQFSEASQHSQGLLSSPSASAVGSARSSFALERASLEANRVNLWAMQAAMQPAPPSEELGELELEAQETPVLSVEKLVEMMRIPPELADRWVVQAGGVGSPLAG